MPYLTKLRTIAEEKLGDDQDSKARDLAFLTQEKLIHELRIQQIELEIQNEELRNIEARLTTSVTLFSGLFNFAPCGYFILSRECLILDANLVAATMLGVSRGNFLNQPFTSFVNNVIEDQDVFYHYQKNLPSMINNRSCELRLKKRDALPFWVQIDSLIIDDPDGKTTILAMVCDINEKKNARRDYQTLTLREKEVFELVVSGRLNKQIGDTLGIVEKTVKVHRAQVMRKMKANSLAELVKHSHRMGLSFA